jgi:hypothetical protein
MEALLPFEEDGGQVQQDMYDEYIRTIIPSMVE